VAASIFIVKMKAARSSEKLASYHITTWHHNSEDHDLNLQHCEKPQISHGLNWFNLCPSEYGNEPLVKEQLSLCLTKVPHHKGILCLTK